MAWADDQLVEVLMNNQAAVSCNLFCERENPIGKSERIGNYSQLT